MGISFVAIFSTMALLSLGIILGSNLPLLPIFDDQMHLSSERESQLSFHTGRNIVADLLDTQGYFLREISATMRKELATVDKLSTTARDVVFVSENLAFLRIININSGLMVAIHRHEGTNTSGRWIRATQQTPGACVDVEVEQSQESWPLFSKLQAQCGQQFNYATEPWGQFSLKSDQLLADEPRFVDQFFMVNAATVISIRLHDVLLKQWGIIAADVEFEALNKKLISREKIGVAILWDVAADKIIASDSPDYNPVDESANTFDSFDQAMEKTKFGEVTGDNLAKLKDASADYTFNKTLHVEFSGKQLHVGDVVFGGRRYRFMQISEAQHFKEYRDYFTMVIIIVTLIALAGAIVEVVVGVKLRAGSKNIVAISRQLEAATTFEGTEDLDTIDEDELDSVIAELAQIQDRFLQMKTVLNISAKYIPKEVITEFLMEGSLGLGMIQTSVTMLFIDIERFTSLCERLSGDDLPILLERYFETQSNAILRNGGTIDKFIGDAIMVVWGAPSVVGDHNVRGLATAVQLRDQLLLDSNATLFTSLGVHVAVRIGVHHGTVMAGNMGCDRRVVYTVVGHNAVVASSLENVNKEFGSRICVSDAALMDVPEDSFLCRFLGRIKVCNKPCTIYELLGVHPQLDITRFSNKQVHEHGEAYNDTASRGSRYTSKSKQFVAASESHVSSSHATVKANRLAKVATTRQMIHETLKLSYPCSELQIRQCNKYREAVMLYIRGNFTGCLETMKEFLELCEEDAPEQRAAKKMIAHCESNMISPPAMDEWNGDIPTST